MWDCFEDPEFLFEVIFRLLPTIIFYTLCTLLFKYASDWF